jgi:hypothetical protein
MQTSPAHALVGTKAAMMSWNKNLEQEAASGLGLTSHFISPL